MASHELTPEEGFRLLNEVFGAKDPSAPPTRTHRILEYQDATVFRLPRYQAKRRFPHELDVFWDDLMAELFGPDPDSNEIVPQKLANNPKAPKAAHS